MLPHSLAARLLRWSRWGASFFALSLGFAAASLSGAAESARAVRLLCAGDSITEGGSSFSNWRFPLWEKLTAAGYHVEFVGSRTSPSRIGPLRHEGYGGKNVEFLAAQLEKSFPSPAPDILLLHAGHNHFADEKPVPGMLAATERIIARARGANPRVIVLLAQVIPSLKLPKYSYIPEFNSALLSLASRLSTSDSPVRIVDQASGFDPAADTVADLVHPNDSGAAKMAGKWFQALVAVLPAPAEALREPEILTYKSADGRPLSLHVFSPAGTAAKPRPAIVFFFGGGWSSGTPLQHYPEARHFADRGYVAFTADYRITATHPTATPFDSLSDAKSVIRYLRQNSGKLGIDPNRIIAAGASAGGQLAAACALSPAFDDPADDLRVTARPDALLLWYPVLDNGPGGYGADRIGERYPQFSPIHLLASAKTPPPTLLFLGTKDSYLSSTRAQEYQRLALAAGGQCELKLFEGGVHPLYEYRSPSPKNRARRAECLAMADAFLRSLGYP